MSAQPSLFTDDYLDPTAALAAKDAGMAAANDGASDTWKFLAREAIRKCAADHPEGFTTDAVLALLATWGAETHNTPALGPVVTAAAKAGEIKKTGEQWATAYRRRHRALTVWRAP